MTVSARTTAWSPLPPSKPHPHAGGHRNPHHERYKQRQPAIRFTLEGRLPGQAALDNRNHLSHQGIGPHPNGLDRHVAFDQGGSAGQGIPGGDTHRPCLAGDRRSIHLSPAPDKAPVGRHDLPGQHLEHVSRPELGQGREASPGKGIGHPPAPCWAARPGKPSRSRRTLVLTRLSSSLPSRTRVISMVAVSK